MRSSHSCGDGAEDNATLFLNATMLAGLGGAVLPLVLHLVGRARYRNVEWGAMMFLGLDDPTKFRASRMREMTLLLLRMAIVAALAVALARPILGSSAGIAMAAAPASIEEPT